MAKLMIKYKKHHLKGVGFTGKALLRAQTTIYNMIINEIVDKDTIEDDGKYDEYSIIIHEGTYKECKEKMNKIQSTGNNHIASVLEGYKHTIGKLMPTRKMREKYQNYKYDGKLNVFENMQNKLALLGIGCITYIEE